MPFDKINAIGQNCHLVGTSDGRVLVQSRATGPVMQNGVYTGKGPFEVIRATSQRDRVIVNPIEEIVTPEVPPTLNYYCFSLAGDWTTAGYSAFADGTYYPMLGQILGDTAAWDPSGNYQIAGDYGPSTTREFQRSGPSTTEDISVEATMVPYDEGDTVFTLETLYLGKWLISYADTAPAGYNPMEPAAPLGPWYRSQAGTFSVKFDVWEVVIVTRDLEEVSRTETKLSTQTIAGLTVSGSESADDYESWTSVACNIDFTANKTYPFGTDDDNWQDFDDTVIEIRYLRIFRTA